MLYVLSHKNVQLSNKLQQRGTNFNIQNDKKLVFF